MTLVNTSHAELMKRQILLSGAELGSQPAVLHEFMENDKPIISLVLTQNPINQTLISDWLGGDGSMVYSMRDLIAAEAEQPQPLKETQPNG